MKCIVCGQTYGKSEFHMCEDARLYIPLGPRNGPKYGPKDGPKDNVNHPEHYTSGGIECIAAIEAALTPEEFRGFLKGNVIKYTWRERKKGGSESLRKAAWYLERLING